MTAQEHEPIQGSYLGSGGFAQRARPAHSFASSRSFIVDGVGASGTVRTRRGGSRAIPWHVCCTESGHGARRRIDERKGSDAEEARCMISVGITVLSRAARRLGYPALASVPVSAVILNRLDTVSVEQPLEDVAQMLVPDAASRCRWWRTANPWAS